MWEFQTMAQTFVGAALSSLPSVSWGLLPLGSSWVLLQGLATTQILRALARPENLSTHVLDVNNMHVVDEEGFPTCVVCVILAHTKAQDALPQCLRRHKLPAPWDPVFARCENIVHVCFESAI